PAGQLDEKQGPNWLKVPQSPQIRSSLGSFSASLAHALAGMTLGELAAVDAEGLPVGLGGPGLAGRGPAGAGRCAGSSGRRRRSGRCRGRLRGPGRSRGWRGARRGVGDRADGLGGGQAGQGGVVGVHYRWSRFWQQAGGTLGGGDARLVLAAPGSWARPGGAL